MNKVIVFDIDGTVANNKHRSHWVMSKPKNWKAYNATMADDTLYEDVAWLYNNFYEQENTTMIFATGREAVYHGVTLQWLIDRALFHHDLYMRNKEDYRSDYIVKVEILNKIRRTWGEPFMWFDDRQQVVDAIRAEGVRVMQVAPGDF